MSSPPSSRRLQVIRRYFSLLSNFNNDPKEYETIVHSDMVETEYPNLLSPEIRDRNNEEGMEGIAMGKEVLKFQKFDIQKVFESEAAVIVEVIWSGEVGNDFGPLKQDQALRAYICYVFEFKDNVIVRQRHYDCFEPF